LRISKSNGDTTLNSGNRVLAAATITNKVSSTKELVRYKIEGSFHISPASAAAADDSLLFGFFDDATGNASQRSTNKAAHGIRSAAFGTATQTVVSSTTDEKGLFLAYGLGTSTLRVHFEATVSVVYVSASETRALITANCSQFIGDITTSHYQEIRGSCTYSSDDWSSVTAIGVFLKGGSGVSSFAAGSYLRVYEVYD
jgi:hypothetical protein